MRRDDPRFGAGTVGAQPSGSRNLTPAVFTTRSGHVEVTGVTVRDLRRALRLLDAARALQRTEADYLSERLLEAMTAADEPAVTPEWVRLAQRRSDLRARLLRSGYYTTQMLAELRHSKDSSARSFVARERACNRLFTVKHGRQAIIPAIMISSDGQPSNVFGAVEVLRPLGLDGWELWGWLQSPSGWLSGDVPSEVFTRNPKRAMAAVRAYASELAYPD